MDPQAELLLRKAKQDRAALEFDLPETIYGFHAQQTYEKLLKSLIAGPNVRHERTHDLDRLLEQFYGLGSDPLPLGESFSKLQSYAVFLRYDDSDPMQLLDRARVRADLDSLISFVEEKLNRS